MKTCAKLGRALPEAGDDDGHRPPWWILSSGDLLRVFDAWPMLRHVAVEPRFRKAWCAGWLLVVALALGLPRIWIVTPSGFLPVIRISALDWLQSVHDARRAREAWAGREPEVALEHWRAALAHHPASPVLLRDSLQPLLQLPPRHASRCALAIHRAQLLLRFSHTNAADLDLALRVFEHFGCDDLLLAQLRRAGRLTAAQEVSGLKALFRTGQMADFGLAWPHVETREIHDPDLAVYHAAWRAGWGPAESRSPAADELAGARANPQTRVLALRLSLMVHAHRSDSPAFADDLAGLEAEHADDPVHHVAWWRLLVQSGRRADAVALALRHSTPPASAAEVRAVAQAFLDLGLADHARSFLERFVPELGVTPGVWALYADLLHRQQDWRGLHALAIEIRNNSFVRHSLAGYSYYVEGLARLGEGSSDAAGRLFASASRFSFRDTGLAPGVAANLGRLGFPVEARGVLVGCEAELAGQPGYWTQLVTLAWQMRDADLLLHAARRACQLAPEDLSAQHQLAGALLLHRREPELALYLTDRVLAADATPLPAIVNRALALLLDHRVDAAAALLERLPADSANAVDLAMLRFARLELRAARGDLEAMRGLLPPLERADLFPPQRQRLAELRERCVAANPSR